MTRPSAVFRVPPRFAHNNSPNAHYYVVIHATELDVLWVPLNSVKQSNSKYDKTCVFKLPHSIIRHGNRCSYVRYDQARVVNPSIVRQCKHVQNLPLELFQPILDGLRESKETDIEALDFIDADWDLAGTTINDTKDV